MAQRKGLLKTKGVSADGGGIMFSEWLAMVKPSSTKAKASSSPTNDRRILHRQATSQPDAIVQQPLSLPPTTSKWLTQVEYARDATCWRRKRTSEILGSALMGAKARTGSYNK